MFSTKLRLCFALLYLSFQIAKGVEFIADNQGLTTFPEDVPADVEKISLDYNTICSMTPLPSFSNLREIYVSYNCLTEVPNLCSAKETLEKVYLRENEISSITADHLQCLENVYDLHIGSNMLTAIPSVYLPALTRFHIWGNSFVKLPLLDVITPNLEYIAISGNPLNPAEALQNLGNIGGTLLELTFGEMEVLTMDVEVLNRFQQLEYMKLDGNNFTVIPDLGVNIQITLTKLSINSNPISHVRPKLFRKMIKLSELLLQNCLLTTIPELCQIKPGLEVDLTGNPLACDCHGKELKMAAEAGIVKLDAAPCQEPAELRTIPLSSIRMNQFVCPASDLRRGFQVYQVDAGMFSCGMMKADVTVIDSLSTQDCANHCTRVDSCGGFRFSSNLCLLYQFDTDMTSDVNFSTNVYIIN